MLQSSPLRFFWGPDFISGHSSIVIACFFSNLLKVKKKRSIKYFVVALASFCNIEAVITNRVNLFNNLDENLLF